MNVYAELGDATYCSPYTSPSCWGPGEAVED